MKKEIWTYLETDGQGGLLSASKELLAQAGIIAAAAGEEGGEDAFPICALIVGADHDSLAAAAARALSCGADTVAVIEDAGLAVYSAEFYADAVGKLARIAEPEMILFERTTDGMDLAPRLAALLDAGMISDCVDIEKKDGRLLWVRHAFGGTAAVSAAFCEKDRTQIVSIRPGSFGGAGRGAKSKDNQKTAVTAENQKITEAAENNKATEAAENNKVTETGGDIKDIGAGDDKKSIEAGDDKTDTATGDDKKDIGTREKTEGAVKERITFVPYSSAGAVSGAAGEKIVCPELVQVLEAASDRGMDIGTATVIVAGGNGAGPEGFKLIGELADLLHGAVGASRVAVDKGWISHSHLIGQSGITVTPDLYINCGISGSVQHIVGMRDAKCVISINKDPKALIFNVSDYGIVGDLHKVLPALIAEIRRHRG